MISSTLDYDLFFEHHTVEDHKIEKTNKEVAERIKITFIRNGR